MEPQIFKGIPIYDDTAFQVLEDLFDENRGQILATLPWLVSELIERTNFKDAMTCVYQNGGMRFYLRNDREDLSKKIGLPISQDLYERVLALCDSSGYVEIPSPWGVSECIRRALIASDYHKGMSREDIRKTYGVSSRTLTNIFRCKKRPPDMKQPTA